MKPEAVVNLFDSLWFYLDILEKNPAQTSVVSSDKVQETSEKPRFSSEQVVTNHTRSKSDPAKGLDTDHHPHTESPNSVLVTKRTMTTTAVTAPGCNKKVMVMKKPLPVMKRGVVSKSMSELEFEEVKGFMDLGFVFSEEDKEDEALVEIIPGLQRLRRRARGLMDREEEQEEVSNHEQPRGRRPYLSEAWQSRSMSESKSPLMNWKVPVVSNEIVMKDSLRWWAHSVASAIVR